MHILIAIIIILAVLAIIAAMQSSDFTVTRSASMSAPADKIFAQVNDLHAWEAWSPWAKLDPHAKTTFEGAQSGIGAVMRWVGDAKVGAGSMTITDSRPNELIRIRLEFLKPMQATNTAEFTFRPEGSQTKVTWSMFGKKNFISKIMGLFMNCEKMVGDQFEKGLSQMKDLVEA